MPLHDWTRVDAGLFHAFHQQWIIALCNRLNAGQLPSDYFALPEQNIRGPIPDVLTLNLPRQPGESDEGVRGVAVAALPPNTRIVRRNETHAYLDKVDRVTVRHRHGEVVAVIEVVSPGNTASRIEFRQFVEKAAGLLIQKVHLLVIDVLPPTRRDPHGIHKAIWDEFQDDEFDLPAEKPLILASYDAGPPQVACVETVAVGDFLMDMPLFLKPEVYVPVPLEIAYQDAWNVFPAPLKGLLS